ncbi:MAG TPA: GNVR domain-containing protein [Longimicrobiales bacterium]
MGLPNDGAGREGALAAWVALARRRWVAGGLVAGLVLALAAAVVFLSRPVYRAEARLRLGAPPPMGGATPAAGFFGLLRLGGDPFANDLELFSSRTLVERVVDDVSLNARLDAPRGWTRDSLFVRFGAGRATEEASFALEWLEDGRVRVRRTAPEDSLIATITPGTTVSFGDVTLAPRAWRPGMPRKVRITTLPFAEAVRRIGPRLVVERLRREANVVGLSFDHIDRAIARAAVASMIHRFIELRTAIELRESGETVDSVRVVADHTRRALDRAESALEAWQRETRLVAPEPQSEVFVERYGETLTALERARQELEAVDSALERASQITTSGSTWSTLLAQPDFLANETMGALVERLVQLEAERQALAQRRTDANRELRALVDQIAYLDGRLRSLLLNYRITLAAQVEELEAQVAEMDTVLARMPARAIELARRQRNVRILSEVLVMTEQRLHEEELRQALTFSNVQVIDPPALRYKPVWPRKKLGLAVGLLLAGVFGTIGMVVAERADRSVWRAAEVRGVFGAPVLAAVMVDRDGAPHFSPDEVRTVLRRAAPEGGGLARLAVVAADRAAPAPEVARALVRAAEAEAAERPGAEALAPPVIRAYPPVDSFAAAAMADDGPVVVVVAARRTRRDDLFRAAALLREAGAAVAGAILVCTRQGDMVGVWA